MNNSDRVLYKETISSKKTSALFAALALLFLALFLRFRYGRWRDRLARAFLTVSFLFLFYTFNYKILRIRLSIHRLQLTFGIFTWTITVDNIAGWARDEPPLIMKYGGAGIHFYNSRGRYRASFNFLEYPRLVITLKEKAGPVQEISFTTRQPDQLLNLLTSIVTENELEIEF